MSAQLSKTLTRKAAESCVWVLTVMTPSCAYMDDPSSDSAWLFASPGIGGNT